MSRPFERAPYRAWLLAIFLIILIGGSLYPSSPLDMTLEHIPTVLVLGLLVWHGRRRPLSSLSYTLLFVFLVLHVIGAHFLYSNVPYDEWSRVLTGHSINDAMGAPRNHYDRFVHFMFGILVGPAAADMAVRFGLIRPGFWAAVFAVGFVSLCGNVYEMLEWLLTLVVSPEDAENYNGQQGDLFDAQKDLGLNLAGALISAAPIWLTGWPRNAPRWDSSR